MHCWPDVEGGLREIHRSIKPGGRYFASTFLAPYFRTVAGTKEGDLTTQNFQLFESAEVLKEMVEGAGFGEVEVTVEGRACAIIKARKIEMGEGGWGGVIEVEREVKSEAKKVRSDEERSDGRAPTTITNTLPLVASLLASSPIPTLFAIRFAHRRTYRHRFHHPTHQLSSSNLSFALFSLKNVFYYYRLPTPCYNFSLSIIPGRSSISLTMNSPKREFAHANQLRVNVEESSFQKLQGGGRGG